MKWLIILLSFNAFALEVIHPQFNPKIEMKIIRVETDSFDSYILVNHNYREMNLVCAGNVAFDKNLKAFIEYRNFYNEIAGRFILEEDSACRELARFIESTQGGVSREKPFVITLDRKSMKVEKIVYPKIDAFADSEDEVTEDVVKKLKIPKLN